MRIENSTVTATTSPATKPSIAANPSVDEQAATPSAVSVSISGQALLRQRLFFSAPDSEPMTLDIKQHNSVLAPIYFLNSDDRLLLADMYEFAQAEDINLSYVDSVGLQLASYRGSDNGQRRGAHNQGNVFDLQGHMLSYSFTDTDATAARRAKENPSLQTTRLDRGFIDFQTDKNYSAMSHCDFEFLDLVISRFSASPDDVHVAGRFKSHTYLERNFIEHVSAEVYETAITAGKKRHMDNVDKVDKSPSQSSQPVPVDEAPATLRHVIQKLLQKNGVPSLFETLIRMGR